MNDDPTVKLKHEELAFDQVRFWRFLLASDLIDEATAPLLERRLGFEAPRIRKGYQDSGPSVKTR